MGLLLFEALAELRTFVHEFMRTRIARAVDAVAPALGAFRAQQIALYWWYQLDTVDCSDSSEYSGYAHLHPPLETCLTSFAFWNANHVEGLLADGMMNIPGSMRWLLSRFPSDKIWVGDRFQSCVLVISRQRALHPSVRAADHPRRVSRVLGEIRRKECGSARRRKKPRCR